MRDGRAGDGPVARLDRDGLLEPIAVDPSLTDLLFASRAPRSAPIAATPLAPAPEPEPALAASAVEQSPLFELV